MSRRPIGVAVVGAGVISAEYLRNLTAFPDLEVVAVADLDTARAGAAAAAHGVPFAGDVDAVLELDEVEIVVNLTVPSAHVAVGLASLEAGKHVYSEKPLALTRADGERLVAAAAARGLRLGCAPDTVLGASIQTAARALAAGGIGAPVAVAATAVSPGPERWHPRPDFLYAAGAGPLFDIGPYYLAALVTLCGPIARVAAGARRSRDERFIATGPHAGTAFTVAVPTHVTALIDLATDLPATGTFSFDSHIRRAEIEIIGTEGTLHIADPTFPDGPVRIYDGEWRDLPLTGTTAGRGVGVLDLARALRNGHPHRSAAEIALHVLDVVTAIIESADRAEFVAIPERCERPAALPPDWDPHAATLDDDQERVR